MKQPSVTACLTACNAENFIEEVLFSLCRQTWGNIKILVSDDASDDSTVAIISNIAANIDSNIQMFRQEKRLGWVENTNFLLNKVGTEYFFLCYHDDILAQTYVEDLIGRLTIDDDLIGAYGDVDLQKVNGERLIRSYQEICDIDDPVERGLSILRMEGLPWVSNRGIYRSTVLKTVGGLRKNLAGEFSAAFPWVLGLALEGKFAHIPKVLCHKTVYATGVSTQWKKTYREYLAMYQDMYYSIWSSSLTDAQKDILMLEVTRHCEKLLVNKALG